MENTTFRINKNLYYHDNKHTLSPLFIIPASYNIVMHFRFHLDLFGINQNQKKCDKNDILIASNMKKRKDGWKTRQTNKNRSSIELFVLAELFFMLKRHQFVQNNVIKRCYRFLLRNFNIVKKHFKDAIRNVVFFPFKEK